MARSLRTRTAVAGLRATNLASRLVGRGQGTVIGGRVARLLDPRVLANLSRGRQIVLVSGTNGKTTTTALVAAALGGAASNDTGSNMQFGVIAALATDARRTVALEVDEAWLGRVANATNPAVIVLLNLSRDQLDRAAEVRVLAEKWRDVLRDTEAVVVANANDPLVVYAASTAREVLWCDVPTVWTLDARSCPQCTTPLAPEGEWRCQCGFARPQVDAVIGDGVTLDGVTVPLHTTLPGLFNRANAGMAVVAATAAKVALAEAATRVERVQNVAGRFSERRFDGRTYRVMLAKNPAGVAALVGLVGANTHVVVSINDEIADGRDPSWLYDAPFDRLRGSTVWCTGQRALDIATRLDYDEVTAEVTTPDELSRHVPSDAVVDVIANYTAFAEWMARSTPC